MGALGWIGFFFEINAHAHIPSFPSGSERGQVLAAESQEAASEAYALKTEWKQLDYDKKQILQTLSEKQVQLTSKMKRALQQQWTHIQGRQYALAQVYLMKIEKKIEAGVQQEQLLQAALERLKKQLQLQLKTLLLNDYVESAPEMSFYFNGLRKAIQINLRTLRDDQLRLKTVAFQNQQEALEKQEWLGWMEQLSDSTQVFPEKGGPLLKSPVKIPHLKPSLRFESFRGSLLFPVKSRKIIQPFGKSLDPQTGEYVFHKGLEISAPPQSEVWAIFPGKVVFSGEVPHYGKAVIVDHGEHYYSLSAHLAVLLTQEGQRVKTGTALGLTGQTFPSVYFELRSKNLALNPLQWLGN